MDFDFLSPFYFPIFFLHKTGLYQEKKSSWCYRAYGLLLNMMFSFATVYHTIYAFQTFAMDDIKKFATALNLALTLYSVLFKSAWFVVNLRNIKGVLVDLLKVCYEDRQSGNLNLKKQAIKVTRVVKIYFGSAFIAIAASIGLSLMHSQDRTVPYETLTYYDYKSSATVYWIMILCQSVFSVYGAVVNYSADLFPVILMAFATGLLQDLSNDMERLCSPAGNEPNGIDCDEKLRRCIDHHVKIKKLVDDISEHFSQVVLWQAAMSSVIFCTSVFLLTIVSAWIVITRKVHSCIPTGVPIERNQIILDNFVIQPDDAASSVPTLFIRNRDVERFR